MSVPTPLLERYLLEEVTREERAELERVPDLAEQLAALSESNVTIRRTYRSAVLTHVAETRTVRRRRLWPWLFPIPVALAAVALLFVAPPTDDGHRARGGARLDVFRNAVGTVERLRSGDSASAGDVLQLTAIRGVSEHAWVVSIDGRGTLTLHNDGRLDPGSVPMATGYQLDDAPHFEHFFLVTSQRPIPEARLRAMAARAPSDPISGVELDLPEAEEVDVLVRKSP